MFSIQVSISQTIIKVMATFLFCAGSSLDLQTFLVITFRNCISSRAEYLSQLVYNVGKLALRAITECENCVLYWLITDNYLHCLPNLKPWVNIVFSITVFIVFLKSNAIKVTRFFLVVLRLFTSRKIFVETSFAKKLLFSLLFVFLSLLFFLFKSRAFCCCAAVGK